MKALLIVTLALGFAGHSLYGQPARTHFNYVGNNPNVIHGVALADSILNDDRFWSAVRAEPYQQVDNTCPTNFSMKMLADTLQHFDGKVNLDVLTRRIINFSSGGTDQRGIHIKHFTADATLKNLANTLVHEWVHGVDFALHYPNCLRFPHYPDRLQRAYKNRCTASYRIQYVFETIMGIEHQTSPCGQDANLPCQNCP